MTNTKHPSTALIFDGADNSDPFGAVVPPIYQNSLFTFDSWQDLEQAFTDKANTAIYTRGNNPTTNFVEEKIAQLAGGEKSKLFASGMAAVSAGILHFMQQGDHMITLNNTYGPTISLINQFMIPKMGVDVSFVSGSCLEEIKQAIRPNTKLIYLESPSSVVFAIQDIAEVSKLAKQNGIATILDNSWATPVFQQPLKMGIDLEVHSCSKYLGGHSDIVAGVLIGEKSLIEAIQLNEYELLGAKLSPHEASMLLRSLRTLHLRMDRHQQSAMKIAHYLLHHPKVRNVLYPGLSSFPQHELAKSQMSGFSGLFSFQLACDDLEQIKRFFNQLNLFQKGVSWGGHESLIYAPAISCSIEQSPEQMKRMGIQLSDIRISVGLEEPEDLMADLSQALNSF